MTLWVVPAAILVAGVVPLVFWARRAVLEADALANELLAWRRMRPDLRQLVDDTDQVRSRVVNLRPKRGQPEVG